MRCVHRSQLDPRMEMAPLLDVIFLLLTFFIYSLVVTVRAQVLPVTLPTLAQGEVSQAVAIAAITIDTQGGLYLNQQPIEDRALRRTLERYAAQAEPPTVYLALDVKPGRVDRGPLLLSMIEMLRNAGIDRYYIVGRPGEDNAETPPLPVAPDSELEPEDNDA